MNAVSTSPLAAARVVLRPRKALPFFGRHPWVLDSAIDRVEPTSIAGEHFLDLDGQVVDLISDKGRFIARGLFNSQSRIRVRLFTWNAEEQLDESFFRRKLAAAIELRRSIGYLSGDAQSATSACRLVFSEADGLSGLVVDRYGDCLVVQPTSLAMAQRLEMIVALLTELLAPRAIVLRVDKSMAQLEGADLTEGTVHGELPAGPLTIHEHGLAYEVDLHAGQKTGFYLDQKENRLAAAAWLRGRRVLDMFCYSGGFALHAARAGAADVLGIDASKKAVAQAQRNAEINGLANVRFETGDGFQTLDDLNARQEKFDAVILDPPKFARGRSGASGALMAYHRLNRTAVGLLPPGGILVTCSCTGGVSREDFVLMLSGVAQKTGRDLRILEQRGASADHPVSATCLETEYLKCLICEVT
jgi:23S rRNA (cytosine1962-C5)-methyltransferase